MLDLYVWAAPRELEVEAAAELVERWQAEGGDPAASPFEPSTDLAWFARELPGDEPAAELTTDAEPDAGSRPVWLRTDDPAPARVVGIRLPERDRRFAVDHVMSLAAKYDLVVFEPRTPRLIRPLEAMAAEADATFWPGGAIQAAVAGGGGAIAAVVAWILAIPFLSGIVVLVGGFMALMAIFTFIHAGRQLLRVRGGDSTET